ncbi:MAG: ABC transporter permease [Chloroflexia bacterium]
MSARTTTSTLSTLWQRFVQSFAVPLLAVFTALVISALVIWVTTGDPSKIFAAYRGLWQGAFGTPRNFSETLQTSTPYVFGGLAVALAFKCGLFNIGVEGQLALGAVCAAFVGYSLRGLPFIVHLPLTVAAGLLGGMFWGAIPGVLKAYRGAHEVIVTIMMNYIAAQLVQYLLNGPMMDRSPGNVTARTPEILPSAQLPPIFTGTMANAATWSLHWGFPLAVLTAVAVQIFLSRTTVGFEIRTVGANPNAARYAGMNVARNIVLAMTLSGMLAGAAGAIEIVDVTHRHELGFGSGYGFDSIAIALLGRNNPYGVVAAAVLFGGLKSGATQMQVNTDLPVSIISIIQGLILLFVAADGIIRRLYRIRVKSESQTLTLAPAAVLAEAGVSEAPMSDSSFEIARTGLPDASPNADPTGPEEGIGKI